MLIPEAVVQLLREGEHLFYGKHRENRAKVVVVGPGKLNKSVRVRFLEDYDTGRPQGNSFYRAGTELTALAGHLWLPPEHDALILTYDLTGDVPLEYRRVQS